MLNVLQASEEYGSPEKLAEATEPTAPKVAEHVRSLKSPEAVTAYINLLIAVISLMLQLSNVFHHPPPPGTTQQITININVTNAPVSVNVTNPPPLPMQHGDGGKLPK